LYAKEGADELVFLDITATIEKRKTLSELVNKIAHHVNIPFYCGRWYQQCGRCKCIIAKWG
jgi:cyclase